MRCRAQRRGATVCPPGVRLLLQPAVQHHHLPQHARARQHPGGRHGHRHHQGGRGLGLPPAGLRDAVHDGAARVLQRQGEPRASHVSRVTCHAVLQVVSPCSAFCSEFMAACDGYIPAHLLDTLRCHALPTEADGPGACISKPGNILPTRAV